MYAYSILCLSSSFSNISRRVVIRSHFDFLDFSDLLIVHVCDGFVYGVDVAKFV